MTLFRGIGQPETSQSLVGNNQSSLIKIVTTAGLLLALSVAVFGSQQARAEEGRLGGYTLEDESMLGRYGDVNDEWVEVSNVSIKRTEMSTKNKRSMQKKDNRLGAYSLQDELCWDVTAIKTTNKNNIFPKQQ